jgi:hypothetical protein
VKIGRFEMNGSSAAKRLVGRVGVVGLLSTAPVFLLQSNAFGAGSDLGSGLSSTILANPVPGLVPLPLGTQNGPITQSDVGLVLGSDESASSALGQSLGDGTVSAYIRSWNHQPGDGDALVISAFGFKYASDETSFVNGLDSQLQSQAGQAGNATIAVTGIPGAAGAEEHTSSSGLPLSEYLVSFSKGNTVFLEVVATASGDLTSANAISVANQQFAVAPDISASGSTTNWHLLPGVPLVGLLLCVVIVAIGRMRKYPEALRGLPPGSGNGGAPAAVAAPSGPWASYSSPSPGMPVSNEQHPKVSVEQWQ